MRDLKLFATSRPQDIQERKELKLLAQPLLQNGGSFSDVLALYSTNSVRQMQKVFDTLREKQEAMQAQQQELEKQKLDQQQAQFEQAQQQAAAMYQDEKNREDMNKELDRLNKKEVALIGALSRNENATADNDNSGIADALEITRQTAERDRITQETMRELQKTQAEIMQHKDKMRLEDRKLDVAEKNMKNDEKIARIQAKAKAKPATPKKKK
jgi:aminopeptidase N